jgi:hypothetical protein
MEGLFLWYNTEYHRGNTESHGEIKRRETRRHGLCLYKPFLTKTLRNSV